MSDKDFEKMLKEDAASKKKDKKDKDKDKKAKSKLKGKRGYWQEGDEDASSNDEKETKERKDIDEVRFCCSDTMLLVQIIILTHTLRWNKFGLFSESFRVD